MKKVPLSFELLVNIRGAHYLSRYFFHCFLKDYKGTVKCVLCFTYNDEQMK